MKKHVSIKTIKDLLKLTHKKSICTLKIVVNSNRSSVMASVFLIFLKPNKNMLHVTFIFVQRSYELINRK